VESSKQKRSDVKFSKLAENIEALSLTDANIESLNKYKHMLMDKQKVEEYYQLIACLRDDEYVEGKLLKAYHDMYDVRVLKNTYNKIKFLRTVETKYNISPFNVEASSRDKEKVQFDDDMYKLCQKLFRSNKQNKLKPSTYKDVRLMYIQMIKNIISKDMICSKQVRTGSKSTDKEFVYWMNKEKIEEYLEIYRWHDKCFRSFKPCFIQMFNIEVAVSASHGSWNSPIISRKPTGQGLVRSDEVSSMAKRTSFQAVMAVNVPVAARPGSTSGSEIRHKAPIREQPSMRAAFSKSGGRESKNPFINQMVAGKVKVV
jgi:hypothetical protein